MAAAIQVKWLRDWRPDVRRDASRRRRELECRRHDPDNDVWLAADGDRTPEQRSIRSESIAPEPFADDHYLAAAGAIFVRSEGTAGNWRDAHHRKEIGRHTRADQLHGLAGACQIEVAIEHHACHALERLRSRLPRWQFMRADNVAGIVRAAPLPDHHELLGSGEWKRAEKDRIHDAERRRRRADAERHQHDDETRQRRRARQHPPRLPEVVTEASHRHRLHGRGRIGRESLANHRRDQIDEHGRKEAHAPTESTRGCAPPLPEHRQHLGFEPTPEGAGIQAQELPVDPLVDRHGVFSTFRRRATVKRDAIPLVSSSSARRPFCVMR